MQKTFFITGTDTGVGKTVLTALLLSHLRQTGSPVVAIKPFCSGGRADAELLHALQNGDFTLDDINPFYFPEPLSPLVAARKHKQHISADSVLNHLELVAERLASGQFRVRSSKFKVQSSAHILPLHTRPSTLLIEGAGGLLSPLGEPKTSEQFKVQGLKFKVQSSRCYTALDLINACECTVLVVAPNRLGSINHTLLTVRALQAQKSREIKVILMDINDLSSSRSTQYATPISRITHHASRAASRSNPSILAELLFPIPLFRLPNLGKNPSKPEQIHKSAKKYKKTLAEILA